MNNRREEKRNRREKIRGEEKERKMGEENGNEGMKMRGMIVKMEK